MNDGLQFKVKRVYRFEGDSKTKAFVDLAINDEIVIRGLKVVQGQKDLFVSMPREKGKDGKWYDMVRPLNKELTQRIWSVVLSAYEKDNEV